MMRLENWYLTTVNMNVYRAYKKLVNSELVTKEMLESPKIDIPCDQNGTAIFLIGEVYGRPGFAEGKKIVTSTVKEITETEAITYSGSRYELGKMHKHYEIFCERVRENKPVMFNWLIGKISCSKDEEMTKYRDSICVSANVYVDGQVKYIFGEAKNLNLQNFTVEVDGVEYYINWLSWYFEARKFSHEEANIFIPESIERHHFFKKLRVKEEECFLDDTCLGDPKDVIGEKYDGKMEYLPIFDHWREKQKNNMLLAKK